MSAELKKKKKYSRCFEPVTVSLSSEAAHKTCTEYAKLPVAAVQVECPTNTCARTTDSDDNSFQKSSMIDKKTQICT